jgi:Raf kinase inhibitor-like YbhB/YbcL family protein
MNTQKLICCLAIAAVGLASCSANSTTSKTDSSVAVAPTTGAAPTIGLPALAPRTRIKGIAMTLPWTDGGEIDKEFTCDGGGTVPDVAWTGVPPEAKELALVFFDDDAKSLHWAPIRILPSATGIAAGSTPPSTKFFSDVAGKYKFVGPCPGKGQKHTYSFTLYALPEPLADLSTFTSSPQLIRTLENTAIAVASVKATYAQPA